MDEDLRGALWIFFWIGTVVTILFAFALLMDYLIAIIIYNDWRCMFAECRILK